MASWFSRPFDWDKDKDKDGRMKFTAGPENSLVLTRTPGPIELRAFYDGLVVYRQTSASPDTGNLELVLFPDKWPSELQKHFNPDPLLSPARSGLTELPPGRFVYHSIPRSKIEEKLHKIMLESFLEWMTNHTTPHPSLEFIEGTNDEWRTLKYRLEEVWNKTEGDEAKKKAAVATAITRILDLVFKESADNALFRGLPVLGNELLATIGDDKTPVVIRFEIRNLYGEPLNPHFYLRKLERTAGELAPSPPFQSTDNSKDARLKDDPDKPLAIRIRKEGGVRFDLMPTAEDDNSPYDSPLIWTHEFNATNGNHTQFAARPGDNPTIPVLDTTAQRRVDVIWDNDHLTINKYAELFSVPCELIVATIHKESRGGSDNKGDIHSIRFEKINPRENFAIDYEDLKVEAKKVDSKLTEGAVNAYWRLAGTWSTDPNSPSYLLKRLDVASPPKLEPSFPVDPADPIGTGSLRSEISWEEIEVIEKLKSHLITRRDMVLPPLGKKDTKTHYQLIEEHADLGADVALVYYKKVGGIGLEGGKEVPLKLPAVTVSNYPLPFDKHKDFVVLTEGTKTIKWRQLLILLDLLRSKGIPKAPKACYLLQPLRKENNVDIETRYIIPTLARLLAIEEVDAKKVFARYTALVGKGLLFTDVGTPPEPGVKAENGSVPDVVTLKEAKAMSEIFPDRISIGLGQALFDTAARKIITWVRMHFTNKFFTDLVPEAPPGDVVSQIPWLWKYLWENRELQIAFIAAYHKQNATVFWQAFEEDKDTRYRVGERMTMFDFPRVGACYNAGRLRKAEPGSEDSDWGLVTFGAYQTKFWSALEFAIRRFETIPRTDAKWAKVRLSPDLTTNSGMDQR